MSGPHPHTILFARGAIARLALWPTLRLAVHASWGGPASAEKQRWLAGVLVDQFETFIVVAPPTPRRAGSDPAPDAIYVEELLLQIMADEFDVTLEDDSAASVARDVIKLFDAVRTGDDTFVKELEAQADLVKGKVPKHVVVAGSESGSGSESGDEDSDDEGEEEIEEDPAPQLLNHSEPDPMRQEPEVDEDGFTVVKRKGRR